MSNITLPDTIGCTYDTAAEYLGLSKEMLIYWLKKGYITSYGNGTKSARIHTESLRRWTWWQTSTWPEGRTPYEFVYLLVCMKVYKIGLTNNIAKRIAQLQGSCPRPIELVHLIPTNDAPRGEAFLHRLFCKRRSHGEWFNLDPNDIKYICQCQALLF